MMYATMLSAPKWLNHLQFFMVNMTLVVACGRQVAAQPTSQVALSSFSASQIEQMLEIRELAQSKGEFGTININAIKQLAAELKNREQPLKLESADLWAIVQDKKLYKEVRSDAALMLLNRDDPKIESHLLSLAKSKEYWGIDLLAQLERNSAIKPLVEALDSGYYHAVVGLGKLKVQRAVPKLVALFGPNFTHDADLTVLQWVVTALGEIGDKRGVDFLLKQLASNAKAKTDYTEPKTAILIALSRIGDERAFEPLKSMFEAGDSSVVEALQATGGTKSVQPILKSMLRYLETPPAPPPGHAGFGAGGMPGPDPFIPNCINALTKACSDSIDPLFETMPDGEQNLAVKLGNFLGAVILGSCDPRKYEKLEPYLADRSHSFFYLAFVALCQRGDKRDLPRLLESLECLSEENMGRSSLHLLAQFGDELVDPLLKKLNSPDVKPRLQIDILDLLFEIGTKRAKSSVSTLLRSKAADTNSDIPRLVMWVLGGDPNYKRKEIAREILPDLLFGLTIKNDEVVYLAMRAIGWLDVYEDQTVRDSVAALIPKMKLEGQFAVLVNYYLIKTRDDRAVPLLMDELKKPNAQRNYSEYIGALVTIGSPAAVTALVDHGQVGLQQSQDVRNALRYLNHGGLNSVLNALMQFDLATRIRILEQVRYAILDENAKISIGYLRANLRDENPEIRLLSAEALAGSCLVNILEQSEQDIIASDLKLLVSKEDAIDQSRLSVFVSLAPQLVEPLLKAKPNLEAAIALGKVGYAPAFPFLIEHLKGTDVTTSEEILKAVAGIRTGSSVEFLFEQSASQDPKISRLVVDLLYQQRGVVTDAWQRALKDPRRPVRSAALIAEQNSHGEAPAINELLIESLTNEADDNQRALILDILESIRVQQTVETYLQRRGSQFIATQRTQSDQPQTYVSRILAGNNDETLKQLRKAHAVEKVPELREKLRALLLSVRPWCSEPNPSDR